jgi:hypothetical protein
MAWRWRLGQEPLAWALRRFHTPVDPQALVLEVGSGGNPYPRANVLLDADEATRERRWVPLATDRPTVRGFVENLPLRDKAFDTVISAHVLKHSTATVRFIAELQHVRYFWRARIDCELLNAEADAAWTRPPAERAPAPMGARRAARPAVAAPPAARFCGAGWCSRHERRPAGSGPG